MSGELVSQYRKEWLLAIGQRLRAEYDALAQPLPLHLLALVKQLDQTPIKESGQPIMDIYSVSGAVDCIPPKQMKITSGAAATS